MNLRALKRETAETFAPRIIEQHGRTVEGIIALGALLLEAKAALPHGEFERLFRGHPNAVPNPAPFGPRSARRLMSIAAHPVLSNRTHVSDLPSSWGTLYELSKVPNSILLAGMESGAVAPDMERADVRRLLGAVEDIDDDKAVPPLVACIKALDAAVISFLVTEPSAEARQALRDWMVDCAESVMPHAD